MEIKTRTTTTTTLDEKGLPALEIPNGAIEDTIKIIKLKAGGYISGCLCQDNNSAGPDDWGDDGLFLVAYHRDFTVDRGQRQLIRIFKKEEFKKDNGYSGRVYADGYGWKSYREAKKEGLVDKEVRRGEYIAGISQDLARAIANGGKDPETEEESYEAKDYIKKYHIFGLEAYVHSGVVLALSHEGNFCDRQWDVSQLGLVFVSKKEWRSREKAREAALELIETWNQSLSGDVYGWIVTTYDKKGEEIDQDSCWGYYGHDCAIEELAGEIKTAVKEANKKEKVKK